LATQLVLGTLAWRGWLDARLAPVLDRDLGTLDPRVRAALRIGAYQLLKLSRIPPHAAINETVSLGGHRGARAMVNAVLRRVAPPSVIELPPAPADPLAATAIETSHPEWIVQLFADDLTPRDLTALLLANNQPAPTTLRINIDRCAQGDALARLAADGIQARPGRWAASCLQITEGASRLRGHPLLLDGTLTVQSEASQLVVELLAPDSGERILDLCAAPGGKAGAIAERVGSRGSVVAIDPTRAGTRRLASTAARLRTPQLRPLRGDGRLPPLRGEFDGVLIDAPCSGLGTLRRHPEIRWRRRPDDLPRLAALQTELLDAAAPLVRPGGRLVYAVCTLAHVETFGVVRSWLDRHERFAVEPATRHLGSNAFDLMHDDALRTLPAPHDLDGFFAVRLVRSG